MPLSEAAQCLRENKDRIISIWEKRARAELPGGAVQSRPALIDSLPVFIDEIAQTLESLQNNTPERTGMKVPKEHGQQRAALKTYSLDELLREYYILQEIILGVMQENQRLDRSDEKVVLDAMFRGIRESATEFAHLTVERERLAAEELRAERDVREQFVAALAHDLRNPLSAARAAAQILLRSGDNPELRTVAVARLNSSIDHADRMIRDLLDTSQIHAGRPLNLEFSTFELGALIEESVADMSSVHGSRFVFSRDGPQVGCWSRAHLRRVFENLFENAVKYGSRHSEIAIALTGSVESVEIQIRNQGDPIPEAVQEQVFKPFYTLARKDGARQQGWGLGLPLVRGIVETHGGRIELRSNKDEGTTFKIRLPRNSKHS